MFVFCCYSTSVFWLFGQLVHNLKTHLKFKHAVCTSYHNICDLFIIKNKWTKTKKSSWLSLQEMVLYKRCVYTAKKNTKPNKTKKFNSWKHFSTNKAEKRDKKKNKKQKRTFEPFQWVNQKCLGTKHLRWGLEGFRCGPVSMIKLV